MLFFRLMRRLHGLLHRIGRPGRLQPHDIPDLCMLYLLLTAASLRLALLPYPWNRRLLTAEPAPPGHPLSPRLHSRALRLARLIAIAARLHPARDLTCLRRSLALRSRLRSLGIPASLQYGVRKAAGRILAHAWLALPGLQLDSYHSSHLYSRLN